MPRAAPLLDGLVAAAAAEDPGAVAIRHGDAELTYGGLEACVAQMAAGLAAAGVRPGDRVGLYQPKSIDTVVAMLGALRAGAAYVPIDPQAPAERVRYIVEHCGIRVLFAAGRPLKQLAAAPTGRIPALVVPDDTNVPSGVAQAGLRFSSLLAGGEGGAAARTSEDLAYVLYTSGSTGAPKGVAIAHGQSLAFVHAATEAFGFTSADVFASHAPFNFDLSVIDLYCAFAARGRVVLLPEGWLGFPAKIAKLVADAGITVWNSVPSALVGLVHRGGLETQDLTSLRLVLFAGEPFPLPALRQLAAAVPQATLFNVYGQTEANSSLMHEVDAVPEDGAPLPVGRPLPNYDVRIIDAEGREVAAGAEGELYVIGPAVARGYFADPERTAAAFVPHPVAAEGARAYRTGDRARRDDEGRVVFLGRADLAVKVRGFRVELGEIEAQAMTCEAVAQACAVPLPHPEFGHTLILFVSPEAGHSVQEDAVRARLAETLPKYMRPERVLVRSSLPKTSTQKIDRPGLLREAKALVEE